MNLRLQHLLIGTLASFAVSSSAVADCVDGVRQATAAALSAKGPAPLAGN